MVPSVCECHSSARRYVPYTPITPHPNLAESPSCSSIVTYNGVKTETAVLITSTTFVDSRYCIGCDRGEDTDEDESDIERRCDLNKKIA